MKTLLLFTLIFSGLYGYSQISDVEGNSYGTVVIGQRNWMTENLATSTFSNGDPISEVQDSPTWQNLTTSAWSYFDNDSTNNPYYGKLYNWIAVDDSRGLCPNGWHIPTDDDWKEMELFLGMSQAQADINNQWRGTDEGDKLKETFGWNTNTGTNASGFSALPGGRRNPNGNFSDFGNEARFWTSTGALNLPFQVAYERGLAGIYPKVYRVYSDINGGMSVRCMQNGFVGVEEIKLKELNVYPNPTTGEIKINITSEYVGKEYSIVDNTGNIITSGTFSEGINSMGLKNVSTGIYYMSIPGTDKPLKIIKN
jgi:uncharacterized protein (TIGR02145 family)